MDILTSVNTRTTPQSQKAKPTQVKNSTGGYVFKIGDEARLVRFLTLGTEGGTYYTSAKDLTRENADVVFRMANHDAVSLVKTIVEISKAGRAPKQQPAIFALAIAASCEDDMGRKAALAAIPDVCRTGSTLFSFIKYVEQFRGWGRGLRTHVSKWYAGKDLDRLAYQVVKYRSREDWTHRDVLRMAHPLAANDEMGQLFNWICDKETDAATLPALVQDFIELQALGQQDSILIDGAGGVLDIIGRGNGISWEMLPDKALIVDAVWEALLHQGIPQTALIRQLPRLTRLGLATGETGKLICAQLNDAEKLKKGRVHPITMLVALRTYQSGHSEKGSSTWTVQPKIVDALDAGYYTSFGGVEPSGKRLLVAYDISASMDWPQHKIVGMPLTPKIASAALGMVQAATEPDVDFVGFSSQQGTTWRPFGAGPAGWGGYNGVMELDISARRRLDDVVRYMTSLPAGGTDCALPALYAKATGKVYDGIVIYTDNETWAGLTHPFQALEAYRNHVGLPVRQVVVGMSATECSIADPSDSLSLDVAGFDSAIPNLISDFVAGRV